MTSKHYLVRGLLAATALATAGIGMAGLAQARTADQAAGTSAAQPLPLLRDAFYLRGTDFSENFDSYVVGSNVHGQGGWKGWANDPNAGAFVDDAFSVSPTNSINIETASDLVHEFDQSSGVWVVSAMQYIPADYAGQSYFIMQNIYNDALTDLNWSVQVQFDSASGNVLNDGGVSGGTMPYVTGEWVEIQLVIDLDNNTQTFLYGGTELYTGSWTDQFAPGAGVLEIGAIDLFANAASPVYYDDISITEAVPFAADLVAAPTAGSGQPGETVTYTVTINNTGTTDDTYDLAASGVWTATTSAPTVAVAAGASATFDVGVEVDPGAALGDSDVTTVTATSQGDPTVEATVDVTTTAALGDLIFADGFELPPTN